MQVNMKLIFAYFVSLLLLVTMSVAQSKNDTTESVQKLILEKINETSAPEFEPCNDKLLKKAKFGDLIEIKRKGYFHWAMFLRNETVIQLDNPDFDKLNIGNVFDNFTGNVELRNLKELAGNDSCRVNNKKDESLRKGLKTLSSAEMLKLIKEELQNNVTSYNVITYNCEHFAVKMRFGVPFSSQIDALKEIVKNVTDKLGEMVAKLFKSAANLARGNQQHDGDVVDMSSFAL